MTQRRVENTRVHFWTFSPVSRKNFNKRCKNEIQASNEKYSVDLELQFLEKSILRSMLFLETTRQWGTKYILNNSNYFLFF